MAYNDCALCGKRIDPNEIYCSKCIHIKFKKEKEEEEERKKKWKRSVFFSRFSSMGKWVIVFLLLVLLLWGGPSLYRWIIIQTNWGKSHEEIVLQVLEPNLTESFGVTVTNVHVSRTPCPFTPNFLDKYSVRVSINGDGLQLLELDNIFQQITRQVSSLEESLKIERVEIRLYNINTTNQKIEGLVPIHYITWNSGFRCRRTGTYPEEVRGYRTLFFGYMGDLTIRFGSDNPRKQWRDTCCCSINYIVEAVAKSGLIEDKIVELLTNVMENPYVEAIETQWLWDHYDYYNYRYELNRFSRIPDLISRDFGRAIHISIEFNSSTMAIEDFQDQVVEINTEIVNQLDELITPYNLRFRYELNGENTSITAIQWTFPYFLRSPGSHGDLLFLGGSLDRVTQQNLPVDTIQQMINFSIELSGSVQ